MWSATSRDHHSRDKSRARTDSQAPTKPTRIRPPRIALLTIVTMIVLHVVAPLPIIVRAPFSYAGTILLATGSIMIIWSRRAFQAAHTPIKPFTESTVLIRHGLYRWSRNPMYLGATLEVAGVAMLLGGLTPWIPAIAFFALLDTYFVRREEKVLEKTFRDQYRAYRRSVRRWL
jgi:protein-S-isoprenylcysteine O-methyltransferase Ste14